jgi:hypothetical protein
MVPQKWMLDQKKQRTSVLDFLDRYMLEADKDSGKESGSIIQEMIEENKRNSWGIGGSSLVNVFNIAAFLGLTSSQVGLHRAFDGWFNEGVTYSDKLEAAGCTTSKQQGSLLRQVASRLNYKGDTKIAEHACCKVLRKIRVFDVYFEKQSLFDMRVKENGTATFFEQKWNATEWLEVNINILQE